MVARSIAGGSNIPGYPPPIPSNIPIPDPSVATQREFATLRIELRSEFKDNLVAATELLKATGIARHEKAMLRIDEMEKAQKIIEAAVDRESHRIESLFNEKLHGVEREIKTFQDYGSRIRAVVDKHTDDIRANAKEAIATAFASAKELFTKSEASTSQEITGIKTLISARDEKTSADIQNLNSRLDRGDGGAAGAKQTIDNSRAGANTIIAIVSVCIAGASLLASLFLFVASHAPPPVVNPTVGADTKRVDDLISRVNAISERITPLIAAQQQQQLQQQK